MNKLSGSLIIRLSRLEAAHSRPYALVSDLSVKSKIESPWPFAFNMPTRYRSTRGRLQASDNSDRTPPSSARNATSGETLLAKLGSSKILNLLGPDWFVEITAARVPGAVIWCNFELAREVGFDVPPVNRMTPDLHEQLIDALCYKALQPGENAEGRKTISLYPDKYGGDGVLPALGAGRSGFTPYGDLYIKGIGFTPLFRHDDPDDFPHSHGRLPMREAIIDTVFGELDSNLFTKGATRILAIIDLHEYITDPKGKKLPLVLVARAGRQLRPGHFLAKRIKRDSLLAAFARITRDSNQLSISRNDKRADEQLLDIRATMLRIIDDHARTTAEQFRWRILHGAVSPSNMEFSGALLDLATQSSQPRTAPIAVLDYTDERYGTEHTAKARALEEVYRPFRSKISQPDRELLNAPPIKIAEEMDKAYTIHLQVQLLKAVGLKSQVAERIKDEHPELARRFMELLTTMAELRNPGCIYIGKSPVEDVSVVDVFRLLQKYPQRFFDGPSANHKSFIRACLKPVYKGNRFHRAKKRKVVKALINQFQEIYQELMTACEPYAEQYYADTGTMRESIKARAAFENEPVVMFYRRRLNKDIPEYIEEYKSTGNTQVFVEAIDGRVAASLRNVEALMFNREWRRLTDGGFETQIQLIDCITYSVRAWPDRKQKRLLHICLPIKKVGRTYVLPLAGIAGLMKRQIKTLRFRYTVDHWKSSAETAARLERNEQGHFTIECDIVCAYPSVGRLEGAFYIKGSRAPLDQSQAPAQAYNYVVPDKEDLKNIVK